MLPTIPTEIITNHIIPYRITPWIHVSKYWNQQLLSKVDKNTFEALLIVNIKHGYYGRVKQLLIYGREAFLDSTSFGFKYFTGSNKERHLHYFDHILARLLDDGLITLSLTQKYEAFEKNLSYTIDSILRTDSKFGKENNPYNLIVWGFSGIFVTSDSTCACISVINKHPIKWDPKHLYYSIILRNFKESLHLLLEKQIGFSHTSLDLVIRKLMLFRLSSELDTILSVPYNIYAIYHYKRNLAYGIICDPELTRKLIAYQELYFPSDDSEEALLKYMISNDQITPEIENCKHICTAVWAIKHKKLDLLMTYLQKREKTYTTSDHKLLTYAITLYPDPDTVALLVLYFEILVDPQHQVVTPFEIAPILLVNAKSVYFDSFNIITKMINILPNYYISEYSNMEVIKVIMIAIARDYENQDQVIEGLAARMSTYVTFFILADNVIRLGFADVVFKEFTYYPNFVFGAYTAIGKEKEDPLNSLKNVNLQSIEAALKLHCY